MLTSVLARALVGEHLDYEPAFCFVEIVLQGHFTSIDSGVFALGVQNAALEDGQKRLWHCQSSLPMDASGGRRTLL